MDNIPLLRAVIVDDEKKGISALKLLIEKYTPGVEIVAECMKAPEAIPIIETLKPEIIFLDIDMPGMNGFEMLDRLAWKNFNLVFTTAHQEYGLKALKNNAIDYLLKPINPKELQLTIGRIKDKLSQNTITVKFNHYELLNSLRQSEKSRILVHSLSGIETVDLNDIICLESQSNYTKIILENNIEILTRKTLKEFESQLCTSNPNFMRVHNSYIIHLNKVLRYLKTGDEIILQTELKIPLSKSRRESFFNWLNF